MNSTLLAENYIMLVAACHRAFLVQMVGPEIVGVTAPEAADLVAMGFLTESEAADGWTVPGIEYPVDAFMFSVLMGSVMVEEAADPGVIYKSWKDVTRLRAASLKKWVDRVRLRLKIRIEEHRPAITVRYTASEALTPEEAGAWLSARTRAAKYITRIGEDAQRQVREIVAAAINDRLSYDQLAAQLTASFGGWKKDWTRVARTELQGAYNEGVVAAAVARSGYDTRIARVPERDACRECKNLFLEDGKPKIFVLRDVMTSGDNVGKRKQDWLGTIWPVHPNCRCDTVAVPAGYGFDRNWNLVPQGRS